MEVLMRVKVSARSELAEGTVGYELAAVDESALPTFEPGVGADRKLIT
jgi:hypothetical protein